MGMMKEDINEIENSHHDADEDELFIANFTKPITR
jgi:hypothetical protein